MQHSANVRTMLAITNGVTELYGSNHHEDRIYKLSRDLKFSNGKLSARFTMFSFQLMQLLLLFATPVISGMNKTGSLCTVSPSGNKDDSPAIMDAFKQCGKNGQIEITEGDFTIAKVMDVLDLENCDISIRGKLTWNDDIQYWLKNSISVTYAQRSTAFRLGGNNFSIRGHGQALFFGEHPLHIDGYSALTEFIVASQETDKSGMIRIETRGIRLAGPFP
jgi:hypothetical protein